MKRIGLRGRLAAGVGFSLAIGLASVALAQQQQRAAGPAAQAIIEHLRQIVEALNLTPDQRTKTDAILDKAQEQMTGLRDMDPQSRADKVREVVGGATEQIAAELTPDQRSQFKSRVDEMRSTVASGVRGQILDRVRSAIGSMDLTDDQKAKITSLLDDTSKKLGESAAQGQPPREAMQALREQLAQILTPEQLQTLRDKMQQDGGGGGAARRLGLNSRGKAADSTPAAAQPTTKPAGGGDTQPMMEQTMTGGAAAGGTSAKVITPAAESASEPGTPLDPGAAAPDFKLRTLDGTTVQLSALKGRVTVLFFGSYTCPTFRDRATAIDRLARQVSTTASVYVVYTREAHPTGGWEVQRNKDERIAIAQPTSYAARQSAARECRSSLHLNVPVLVDEMDDPTAAAYGGFPNGAVVINRDGTIAASQQWADPAALQRYIDDAVARKYHAVEK
jgi:Spy/CpxP family protein refolding chaperone